MKTPILQQVKSLLGMGKAERAAAIDEPATAPPRGKAIYLNILVRVEESEAADPEAIMDTLAGVITGALKVGSAAGLTGEIKRVRMSENPPDGKPSVELLLHVRGNQAAPLAFLPLAQAEIRALLEMILPTALPGGTRAAVTSIEENTNAVDELTDEGLM